MLCAEIFFLGCSRLVSVCVLGAEGVSGCVLGSVGLGFRVLSMLL